MSELAYFGAEPLIKESETPKNHLFGWPIMTDEDEAAALDVIRNNKFSGTDITEKFHCIDPCILFCARSRNG